MKNRCIKNLFVITLLGLNVIYTYGQEEYEPILKEGKSWNYRTHYAMTAKDYFSSLKVEGDSIIDGILCKKIMYVSGSNESLNFLMYEKDRRIYNREEDSWVLWFDFNLKVGDEIRFLGTNYYVGATDTIETYGHKRYRLHFGVKGGDFHKGVITWIEGIGSPLGLIPFSTEYSTTVPSMLSCYDGKEKIYANGYTQSHVWEYTYLKDWKTINNTVFGERMTQSFRRVENYESEPVTIGTHSYLIVKAIGRLDQPAGYPLGIREEKGRVYVNYEAYMNHLTAEQESGEKSIPSGNPDYIPYYITGDGEMILYDYNMKVGDAYRHVEGHEDITVIRKDSVRLEDMELRRRLTLSNGLVLIEGLGCTNSPGMMFAYLNPSKEYQAYFCCLSSYNCFWGSDGSIYQSEWDFRPNQIEEIQCPRSSVNSAIYDLQGRRLEKAPQKGIYVQDGKKIVK